MFKRRTWSNALTERFADPKFTVADLLEHSLLGVTVRNDPPSLVIWLADTDSSRKEVGPRFHTVFEWALSFDHNTPAIDERFKMHQLNHNASVILSTPFAGLTTLLTEANNREWVAQKLFDFFEKSEENQRRLAGNFTRILMHFLRSEPIAETILGPGRGVAILTKCIERVHIVAYQELVAAVLLEFRGRLGGASVTFEQWLTNVLDYAAKCTFDARTERRDPPSGSRMLNYNYEEEIIPPMLNYKEEIIPVLHRGERKKLKDPEEGQLRKDKALVNYVPRSGSEGGVYTVKAVQLLISLKAAILEDPSVAGFLQNRQHMQRLFIIGVYADPDSILAHFAFGLLRVLIFGDEYVASISDPDSITPLIEEYAACFEFADPPTPQMIAAFPLFWNHRYAYLADETYKPATVRIIQSNELFEVRRPPGRTPLEAYAKYLLYDPAFSDELTRAIIDVLKRWNKFTEHIRHPETIDNLSDHHKRVIEVDKVMFEFLRTQTDYGDRKDHLLAALTRALPIDTRDNYFAGPDARKFRVTLNGGIYSLFQFLVRDTNMFWLTYVQNGKPVIKWYDFEEPCPVLANDVSIAFLKQFEPIEDLQKRANIPQKSLEGRPDDFGS
jgi:hypothetical protein